MPAAPLILRGVFNYSRLYGIAVHISQQIDKVACVCHRLAAEAVMKERSQTLVTFVVVAHVCHLMCFIVFDSDSVPSAMSKWMWLSIRQ